MSEHAIQPRAHFEAGAFERGDATWQDIKLAKQVSDILMAEYPGHPWMVWASYFQGIVQVWNAALSTVTGFTLHTRGRKENVSRHIVIKAGGELLERAGIKRGAMKAQDYEKRPKVDWS